MTKSSKAQFDRRRFLLVSAAAGFTTPAIAQNSGLQSSSRWNISGFRAQSWRPYFRTLRRGAVLVDISSRALHLWTEDGDYTLYPSSIPLSEDFTRRGRTTVIRKVENPSWSPTPNMKRRNPEWPDVVPPGPDNPMGTHALHLGWTYYRIHGTQDNRKIGRRSTAGCIGLYNEDIADVFSKVQLGAQVLLI